MDHFRVLGAVEALAAIFKVLFVVSIQFMFVEIHVILRH